MSHPTPNPTLAPETLPEMLAPTRPGTGRPLLPQPLPARPRSPGWGRAWRSSWPLAIGVALLSGGLLALLADHQQPRLYEGVLALQFLSPADEPDLTPAAQITLLRSLAEQSGRWLEGGPPPFAPGLKITETQPDQVELSLRGSDSESLERQLHAVVAQHRQELKAREADRKLRRERTREHRVDELSRVEARLKALPVMSVIEDHESRDAAALALDRTTKQRRQIEEDLAALQKPHEPEISPVPDSVASNLIRGDPRGVRLIEDRATILATMEKLRRVAAPGILAELLRPEQKRLELVEQQLAELSERLTQPLREQGRQRWEAARREQLARATQQLATARATEQAARAYYEKLKSMPPGVDPKALAERGRLEEERRALAQALALIPAESETGGVVIQSESTNTSNALTRYLGTLAAGLLGGIGFGTLVVARQRTHGKIRTARELAETTGLPVLGRMPLVGDAVPIPGVRPGGVAGQEILRLEAAADLIRGPVLSQLSPGPVRLLVTSPGSGDGRTTLATQLACSLARAGKRVLLVDAATARGDLAWLFQLHSEPGLAEVLRAEMELGSVLQATSFSRLWLLPAGHVDAQARAALAQDWSTHLFEPVLGQLDFVIIDGPALDAGPEASAWATRCQAVLLAARADHTPLPAAHAACQRLHLLQAPVLGLVLLERGISVETPPGEHDA